MNEDSLYYIKATKDSNLTINDVRIEDNIMLNQKTGIFWNYSKADSKTDFYIETPKRLFKFAPDNPLNFGKHRYPNFSKIGSKTHELLYWIDALVDAISKIWCDNKYRFDSFATTRENNFVKTYLDGEDYFSDV